MRISLLLVAGLALLGSVTGSPAAGSASATLDAFLAGTETLQADFSQTVLDENLRVLETSSGVVYIHRPGRFRWDYREPSPQLIVADGEDVWIYDKELEQVTVRKMADALGSTPALLLTRTGGIEEQFQVRELGERDRIAWVELRPRGQDATFERIRLGLEGGAIRIMEMSDNFGQTTELRFTNNTRNRALDDALFRFSPPDGADVIRSE